MRLTDLLQFAATGFVRRKGRTMLTLLGVVVGSMALTLIVALGEGLRGQVVTQFTRGESLRQVLVRAARPRVQREERQREVEAIDPVLSGPRRERLRRAMLRRRGGPRPFSDVRLLPESIEELEALEHIERVDPLILEQASVRIAEQELDRATVMAVRPEDERLKPRILLGKTLAGGGNDEALVHELLLYRMGFHSEEEQRQVVGTDLLVRPRRRSGGMQSMASHLLGTLGLSEEERRVVAGLLDRMNENGRESVSERRFRIVGVMGEPQEEDVSLFETTALSRADVMLPTESAVSLYFASPFNRSLGYPGALVLVDQAEHVSDVVKEIEKRGFRAISVAGILENFETALTIVTLVVSLLSAVAMLVASLGIANTMAMSVLERTREVGIMKAVGARDGDVRRLFLLEGGLIGLAGGLLGWVAALLLSLPVEAIGRALLFQQTAERLEGALVHFPAWLPPAAITMAVLVAILAALWPAHRAARIDPVRALRHG